MKLSCGCESKYKGFPSSWAVYKGGKESRVKGRLCERHFHEYRATPHGAYITGRNKPSPVRGKVMEFLESTKEAVTVKTLQLHLKCDDSTLRKQLRVLQLNGKVVVVASKGQRHWKLKDKTHEPAKANPVAFSDSGRVITHRISQPGEEAPTAKRRAKTISVKRQSWFSALEK
jgi:hypothetical protein